MTAPARAVLGAALVADPSRVLWLAAGRAPTPLEVDAARALGVRHLVEAVGLTVRPRLGSVVRVVDVVHAVSMVAAAAVFPPHRRVTLVAGAVAATLASSTGGHDEQPGSRS